MFIFSFENKKYPMKFLSVMLCFSIIAAVASFIFNVDWKIKRTAEYNGQKYSTSAKNISEIKHLAENFGINIADDSPIIENIRIPMQFNSVYQEYNSLQHDIGMDLEKYRGEDCKKYTFDTDENCVLNIIVYNNHFIGGDISEKEFNGKIKSISSDMIQ